MTRRSLHAGHALAALLLLCAAPALPQAPVAPATPATSQPPAAPVYNIELIVFRVVAGPAASEDWTAAATGRSPRALADSEETAAGAAQVGRLVGTLPPAQFQLNDIEQRLKSSGGWEPIAHVAWSQTPSSWGSRAGFALPKLGIDVPGLAGIVYLERGSFLHLGLALKYMPAAGGPTYDLTEIRRVKFYEKNYYDHPAFGAIALITPAQGARPAGR
jgi:hypothetical protein